MKTELSKIAGVRHISKVVLSFVVSLAVQGCDDNSRSQSVAKAPEKSQIAQDMAEFEGGVRIAAANKRIDELERKVGELESTPENLNLDLLSQRLTALELKANNAASLVQDAPSSKDEPSASRSGGSAIRPDMDARRVPTRSSVLKLPDLENGSRLATPAEARSFGSRK